MYFIIPNIPTLWPQLSLPGMMTDFSKIVNPSEKQECTWVSEVWEVPMHSLSKLDQGHTGNDHQMDWPHWT